MLTNCNVITHLPLCVNPVSLKYLYNTELPLWLIPGSRPFGRRVSVFVQSGCLTVTLWLLLIPSLTRGHRNATEHVQVFDLQFSLSYNPLCHFGRLGPGLVPADRDVKSAAATFCSTGIILQLLGLQLVFAEGLLADSQSC